MNTKIQTAATAPKYRPILMSTQMVLPLLNGRKTMTRRVIGSTEEIYKYGKPGDFLWVRETFRLNDRGLVFYKADHTEAQASLYKWKPSIFLPKKYSRIELGIKAVKLEYLHDISDEDIIEEGISCRTYESSGDEEFFIAPGCGHVMHRTAFEAWRQLWIKINGQASWDANPLVVAIDFYYECDLPF